MTGIWKLAGFIHLLYGKFLVCKACMKINVTHRNQNRTKRIRKKDEKKKNQQQEQKTTNKQQINKNKKKKQKNQKKKNK